MELKVNVVSFLLAAWLFGAFTVMIIISTYSVLTSSMSRRTKLSKAGLTLAMYFVSAGHLTGSMAMFTHEKDVDTFTFLEQTLMLLGVINYVISDAVVLWRCWLLWGRKCWVLWIPILLFIATIVGAIIFVAFDVRTLAFSTTKQDKENNAEYLAKDDLVIWCLSLATNVWVTLLVAFKAWQQRRHVRQLLQQGTKRTQLERLMALLVESGALYCLIWVGFLIIYALTRSGSFVMDGVMVQIAGIYPTILIILVNFGKTPMDNDFAYNEDGLAVQRRPQGDQASALGIAIASRDRYSAASADTAVQPEDKASNMIDRKNPIEMV